MSFSASADNAAVGELIVVTGPPGAGKSSVSEELAKRWKPSALVPGDVFFGMIKQGYVRPWLPQSRRQNTVIIEAAAAAAGRLCNLCLVVYEGVVGPWFLPTFLRATGLASMHYVVLLPPLDVCIERVRTRVGHGFADLSVSRDLYRQFVAAAVDSRHVITEPDSEPANLAELIDRQLGRGTFRYQPS
jgi:cytidylate kinase